ncbi:MAG: glycosyl transferase family protein [Paracoccaceae bacterium]
MSLAPFVHAMGRGPGRARSLTRDEAREAMGLILAGDAAPEAVGALLMLMRYRGETSDEIAGFVDAARAPLGAWVEAGGGLDWPCYAAGRSRGHPWFLLAAKLVATAGTPVLLHGWTANAGRVSDPRGALRSLGIAEVDTPAAARAALGRDRIAFLPLDALSPGLLELLRLREVLGLRSAVNTVLRVLNPCRAPAAVQGVFHPPYRELQRAAACALGQPGLAVIKGGGGEFERHPGKAVRVFGLAAGCPVDLVAPATVDGHCRLAEAPDPETTPEGLWRGEVDDAFAEATVLGTAALALVAAARAASLAEAEGMARDLWRMRVRAVAA